MARVLVVDDFEDNIFLLEEVLSILQMEYQSVTNGQEAVIAMTESNFDIVLMDIEMPVMNGFEASEEIRSMSSPKGDVPIIAISAHSYDFFADKLQKYGMNDYISKPYTLPKLKNLFVKYNIK